MGFLKDFGAGLKRQLTTLPLIYLGGHPGLAQGNLTVGVGKGDDSIVLYAGPRFEEVLSIPKSDITNITLEKEGSRSVGKAAAGAVIGGVLTGGIGAVAGAAVGGRKKDASIIALTVNYNDSLINVLFSGDDVSKKYSQFAALLK